tara:strand:- start:310 stop:693 length:384 start_codon:yes stop_codon:yes gene_type:complete
MESLKKIATILLFATAPFYEACVMRVVINNPDLSQEVSDVVTNMEQYADRSVTHLKNNNQVEKPLKPKRKKKVIKKKRRKPKRKVIKKKKRRPKKRLTKKKEKVRRKPKGRLKYKKHLEKKKKKDKK